MNDTQLKLRPAGPGMVLPVLIGAVLALVGASLYMFFALNVVRDQLAQLRSEQAQTREQLLAEISRVQETSAVTTQTNQNRVELLKAELETARQQAGKLVGDAQLQATKRAEEISAQLERVQQTQARKMSEVSDAVSQVKTDTETTKTRVSEVSNEVGSVKVDLSTTKTELEKTRQDLKSTIGDLGLQSGLIATNAKELAALKYAGERNYTEFTLKKEKNMRRIGEIQVRLKVADPGKNRYTLEVIADDRQVEKKDKTVNEPVQFKLSKASLPYELVVNEIKKDTVSGYLSAPKL